jgi:hypothetical protein
MSQKTTRRKASTAAAQKLPRAPLPRQTGGPHEDKTRRPWRERKHKGREPDE